MKNLYTLFFFLHFLQLSDGGFHSIRSYSISSQGLNLPDYMERITVDDVTVFNYNTSITGEVHCPEWLNTAEAHLYWKHMNILLLENKHRLNEALQSAIQQFNQTASSSHINVYQEYAHCDLYTDGTQKAKLTNGFNGEDFLTLDIDSKTYIASVPQAEVYKRLRQENRLLLEFMVDFYRNVCFNRLKMFLQYTPHINETKAPDLRLFERSRAGSTVLTCHVTGFYPREVQVEWVGEGLQSVDDETISVLPNGDGTYQTRRSVIRPEENPENHNYSCVVHHSSVPGNISRTISRTWVTDKHTGPAVWILLVCGLLVIYFMIITGTGLYLKKCKTRPQQTNLNMQIVPAYTDEPNH